MNIELDQATLRSLVRYEPESGNLVWLRREELNKYLKAWNTKHAGKSVGQPDKDGYLHAAITLDGVRRHYLVHRLIWLYVHGEWPKEELDHSGRVTSDNRLDKLRDATRSQNMHNTNVRRDNTSGSRGVYWYPTTNKWRAVIKVQKRTISLGYFNNIRDAEIAYASASLACAKEFSIFAETA